MESKEQAKSKLIDTIGHYNLTANNVSKFSFNKRETELFTNMMVEFVKEQTTSQQQNIERLRELLESYKSAYDNDFKIEHHIEVETEQLLNTTEPIETSKANEE